MATKSANRDANRGERSSSLNVVGVHYRVGRKIGEGSFGVIHEGTNLLNNQAVAIKFEPRKTDAPQLRDEYRTYKILAGCPGIPQVHYFGTEGIYNVLVLDLLGPSLEDLFELCNRKFTIKTVCMLAKQMLARVRNNHEKCLIYRDIKPDNFLIGRALQSTTVYMIDFGMAKYYKDPQTGQHIPYREKKSLSGTARYMSINTHLGREQSRRDDLEALGHVFFYFLRGSLPWQGLKAQTNKQKYEKIGEKKQQIPINELCAGFPQEFATYLSYARNLKFEETPDYSLLMNLFEDVLRKQNLVDDGVYDWMLLDKKTPEDRVPRGLLDANGPSNHETAVMQSTDATADTSRAVKHEEAVRAPQNSERNGNNKDKENEQKYVQSPGRVEESDEYVIFLCCFRFKKRS